MSPAERLEEAFQASKLKHWSEFARRVGVKPVTMRAYKDGRFDPPLDVCERIGEFVGFSARWLFEQAGPKTVSRVISEDYFDQALEIPIIDEVTAGNLVTPSSQIPQREWKTLAMSGLPPSEYFALVVKGNSMDRLSPEGSTIVIDRRDKSLVSGRAYVFAIDDEMTYKRWQEGDPPFLEAFSTDPTHKPRIIKRRRDLGVVGRVRRSILKL